ncbi:MFS transporter [Fischerella thermalis CCMEE 5198]|jgi:MFS family permease|uniref:MFS transporter n=1 Tax=Fischerella thermalis TaxID=372787 RepID=UPI000C810042|nr:MFS transporter [Fischerella thermalis]PLZ84755.1 MFS transporter [Fischerella thermalis CCMEE 5196]PMB18428.1 MFS transporter [Fischerella thermalis CCMEE 5198]
MNPTQLETASSLISETSEIEVIETTIAPSLLPIYNRTFSKDAIRTSLRASTIDGIFAGIFGITTGGILLSNFLVELDAAPVAFGMLASIPMLVNFIQPLGAYISERFSSRYQYSLLIYAPSRLIWLILVICIAAFSQKLINSQQLVILTLLIVFMSHLWGGLGSASWLSWMATLVHRRLRGRYFGIRSSIASLTNLICVPLAGLAVSHWYGGTLQGYGILLFVGILFGMISLACQHFKLDVNPHAQNAIAVNANNLNDSVDEQIADVNSTSQPNFWQSLRNDTNFLIFLLYFSVWMFAVNLCNPFFNLYMLDTLDLDVSWVTFYGSLQAGANMLMLILWGRLADKIGNRPILFFIGIFVAIAPLLWLGIGYTSLDIWLWLPMLHIFLGGTGAAIDLCGNNMQLEVAPTKNQSIYFATVAAIAGLCGAFGTILGGFLVQINFCGGLLGLFVFSTVFRLVALLPIIFVQESRGQSFVQTIQSFWTFREKARG